MEGSRQPEDERVQGSSHVGYKVAFLAGTTLVAFLTGFGFTALGATRAGKGKKLKGPVGPGGKVQEHEDPVLLATRALGWGTMYSVAGTGTIGLAFMAIWKM